LLLRWQNVISDPPSFFIMKNSPASCRQRISVVFWRRYWSLNFRRIPGMTLRNFHGLRTVAPITVSEPCPYPSCPCHPSHPSFFHCPAARLHDHSPQTADGSPRLWLRRKRWVSPIRHYCPTRLIATVMKRITVIKRPDCASVDWLENKQGIG
jgi:hypothetical protein